MPFGGRGAALEHTLGSINLKDIKAPEYFYIKRKLRELLNISMFHDDQRGIDIISSTALLSALELVGKQIGDVKMAVSGAGAACHRVLGRDDCTGYQASQLLRV